ncbi:MAG: alpha-1,4-glucan--maltose-1-phosphate maltosyltransferase [Terriglobia bacterium]
MNYNAPRTQASLPAHPRTQVVIEQVAPEVEGGRFPIKRITGDRVEVTANIFADGHDLLSARVCCRKAADPEATYREAPMLDLGNDRWSGQFQVTDQAFYEYTVLAWVDRFKSWRRDLDKKIGAGRNVAVDLLIGAELIKGASTRAASEDSKKMKALAKRLQEIAGSSPNPGETNDVTSGLSEFLNEELDELMAKYSERRFATKYNKWLGIIVDRGKARFSAWYEMFPRSATGDPGKHGTFRDCEAKLPYIAAMGFDVLYFPPIHPIGRTHRKGRNNDSEAGPDDVGSPWAIGEIEGGHKSIHPQLGTFDDFQQLVTKCHEFGVEVALDFACQCSPDHPYVKEHPEWFRRRPDGSVQYAENPPKQYQDIYPFDFESDQWQELWQELKSVVLFWIDQGVRIFRVDNPHTKPFVFWEWLIREIKAAYPEVLFLAEAFTRPAVMYELAKLGFSQSYTYFAWRNTKRELTQYFTELTKTQLREFFRPHLWPNTPDILTEYLQLGGRAAFMIRLILAATLGANYGIYGPAFELCENHPLTPGKEEYLKAEKYEIRAWNTVAPGSLKDLISRINRARRENPALQSDTSLLFHPIDNEQLIAYSKATADLSNIILTVVNLDPNWKQSGWVEVALDSLRLDPHQPFQMHDLLTDARYAWHGSRNYVELNPQTLPAHVFHVGAYSHRA